ncbi:MAG: glycosyltransferase family 2 protein [Pararhodobacter sp.]
MKLSIVIPVHDDAEGLARMLHSLQQALPAQGILAQVIVVDDGSPVPMRQVVPACALRALPLEWQRSPQAMGAGHARNVGLTCAIGSHVLFLDADDTVTPALGDLLVALETRDFDFALFAHDDSRRLAQGATGADEATDRALWADLAVGPAPQTLTPAQAHTICRISNYPWNKVWRRDFLRQRSIAYTEITLHNDIEPHWAGFIEADRILCSGQRCVIHQVAPHRTQLTNRRGAERLCVFRALDAVAARLQARSACQPDGALFAGPFLEFTLRLLDWVAGLLDDPADRAELQRHAALFLQAFARQAPPALARATHDALAAEPGLALRFLHWAEGGRARDAAP